MTPRVCFYCRQSPFFGDTDTGWIVSCQNANCEVSNETQSLESPLDCVSRWNISQRDFEIAALRAELEQANKHLKIGEVIRAGWHKKYTQQYNQIEKLKAELDQARRELADARMEIKADDLIIAERERLLSAIPECPQHGSSCVPHAIEWVNDRLSIASELERVRAERDALQKEQDDDVLETGHALAMRDTVLEQNEKLAAALAAEQAAHTETKKKKDSALDNLRIAMGLLNSKNVIIDRLQTHLAVEQQAHHRTEMLRQAAMDGWATSINLNSKTLNRSVARASAIRKLAAYARTQNTVIKEFCATAVHNIKRADMFKRRMLYWRGEAMDSRVWIERDDHARSIRVWNAMQDQRGQE